VHLVRMVWDGVRLFLARFSDRFTNASDLPPVGTTAAGAVQRSTSSILSSFGGNWGFISRPSSVADDHQVQAILTFRHSTWLLNRITPTQSTTLKMFLLTLTALGGYKAYLSCRHWWNGISVESERRARELLVAAEFIVN